MSQTLRGEPVETGDQLANMPNRRPHRAPFGDGVSGAPAVPITAVALAGRRAAGAAMHPTGPAAPYGRTATRSLVSLVPRLATWRRVRQRQGTPPSWRMGLMAH